MYRQLHQIGKSFCVGVKAVEELQGKNVILFLGPTGSGKSTIANAILQGIDFLELDEDNLVFKVKEKLIHNGREVFTIGHEAISCTSTPSFYPCKEDKDTYFVDCPGFGDTDPYKEFPNMTLIHEIIKHANKVTICMVVKGACLDINRGSAFLQVLTSIMRILSDSGLDQSSALILPLINEP